MDHVVVETPFAYSLEGIPKGSRDPRLLIEVSHVAFGLRRIEQAPLAVVAFPRLWGTAMSFEPGRGSAREVDYVAHDGALWRAVRVQDARPLTLEGMADFGAKWRQDHFRAGPIIRPGTPLAWSDNIKVRGALTGPSPLVASQAQTIVESLNLMGEIVSGRPMREVLWDDREERAARTIEAATQDFLVIGDIIYVRTPGPSWTHFNVQNTLNAHSDYFDGYNYLADEADFGIGETDAQPRGTIDIVDVDAYRSAAPSQEAACIFTAIHTFGEIFRRERLAPALQIEMARLELLAAEDWYPSPKLPWLAEAEEALGRIAASMPKVARGPSDSMQPLKNGAERCLERLDMIRARRAVPAPGM